MPTLRELKYIIYGDDRLGGVLNKITGASQKATGALGGVQSKVESLGSAQAKAGGTGSTMQNVMGGIAQGASRMLGPLIAGAGGVALLTTAFNKGSQAVEEFRLQFRKLENLNMSKSDSQIGRLRDQVLGMAMLNKFDPGKVSQAYFDVQSLTGKEGVAAELIITKQGNFAKTMQADFNEYIASTGKSMKNYGFGVEGLDMYNKANLGVFNTGYIDMNQLAKASSVYAGPAAAANQTPISANKLMALFTVKTKSPDEAATMTKSAFTDLFKKDIAKSFKDIGINLYDVNGKAKQVDKIMLELNAKFADKTSAKQMDELRNKFTGSEGINALLSAAKDQTGDLQRTFENFDKAGSGFENAIRRGKNDINTINDDINNKLKTSWTALGEALLPAFIEVKKIINSGIDLLNRAIPGYGKIKQYAEVDQDYQGQLSSWTEDLNKNAGNADEINKAKKVFEGKINQANQFYRNPDGSYKSVAQLGSEKDAYAMSKQKETYTELMNMANQMLNPISTGGGSGDGDGDGGAGGETGKMLSGISGGGTRNITVNITKMVETFNVNTTNISDSSEKVKADIEETLVRAIAGAEQAISN